MRSPPDEILYRADLKLKDARELYKQIYGRKHTDHAVESELHEVLRKHNFAGDGDVVPVRAELLLALILRPRGKRPPKERWTNRWNKLVVRHASTLWAEAVAAGEPSKRAKHDAAVKASRRIYGHDLSVSTIEMRMRLKPKKNS